MTQRHEAIWLTPIKNATINVHFSFLDLYLKKRQSGKSHDYREAIVFEKLHFQNVFRPHENEKPAFSNSWLEERFRKAPFSWRISVHCRPNRRNKASFSNLSGLRNAYPGLLFSFYHNNMCEKIKLITQHFFSANSPRAD